MPIVVMYAKNITLQVLLLFNMQYRRGKMKTHLPLKKIYMDALEPFFPLYQSILVILM